MVRHSYVWCGVLLRFLKIDACRLCRVIWKRKRKQHKPSFRTVLKKAKKSKPSGLFFSEDLALAILQRRAAQVGKLREAKQAGKIAYFVLDRPVIRDKKYH